MKKRFFVSAMVISALLATAAFSQAAVIRVPQDYPTVQQGINAASSADTVLVSDGTYYENIDFLGKAITVRSENGPAVTVIDGNQSGSVVSFKNNEGPDSHIDGFTITNGSGTDSFPDGISGGGIFCAPSGTLSVSPTIINNTITGNSVAGCGAGIYSHAYNFGGVIRNNVISNNSAGGSGGAVYLRDVRVTTTIEGNTITQNTATGQGGGVWIGTYGTPNIRNNTVTFNTARAEGGGIFVHEYTPGVSYLTVESNTIRNNAASSGGGIFYRSNATIANNTISENTATSYGGGVYVQEAGGIITNNIITNNSASNLDSSTGGGGGITCHDNSNPTIVKNTIAENSAFSTGGGIFCWINSAPVIEKILYQKILPI